MGLQIQGRGNIGNTQKFWMKINRQRWGTDKQAQEDMRYREEKDQYEEAEGEIFIVRFPIRRFQETKQNPLQPKLLF